MTRDEVVDLYRFLSVHKTELDSFAAFWIGKMNQDQKAWPEKLTLGDWEEQYLMWLSTQAYKQ